ncbi:hypothetical protein CRYUN_Cryun34aG0093500 [Craigia yunnanensis]
MFSISLDISLSGLLNYMLANFIEIGIFSLLELIDQGRASNIFENQNLDSMQLLQEIPLRKNELASSEMKLDSLRKKFSEFKNFKAARSNNHTTRSNQSRLKTDVSADSIVKQENLFPKFRNEGASSSEEVVKKSCVIISHPINEVCSSFHKGKVVLQASEAEQLNTRLTILEEENEILKQAFLETVVESKKLVNEVCQLFQRLRYSLHPKDQEDGHSYGSLIIKPSKGQGGGMMASSLSKVLLENPGTGDPKANVLANLGQSYTCTRINLHCN